MMKKFEILTVFCLSLLWLGLARPSLAQTGGSDTTVDAEVIGVASAALRCLAVGPGAPAPAAGTVNLTWQGQAQSARLIVQVAGPEANHTIKVNGQAVAQVPLHPQGGPCSAGEDSAAYYLDVPVEILVQGDNIVEITNDALTGDSWTAAYVRLEVQGDLTVTVPDGSGQIGPADVSAQAVPFTIGFTSSYDGSSQQARVQIPDSYSGGATPLLVAVHPRSGSMFFGENEFGSVVNNKGWLLASAELHGSWPASDPTQPPSPGAYAYASLESQYDIIDTVRYMVQNPSYNVDPKRIYIVGYSMGGQTATVVAAKYPHLFAAIFDNKGPTDWVQWYNQTLALVADSYTSQDNHRKWMERECHIGGVRKTPTQNPFCYQRRSSLTYASNYIHLPIRLTHSASDKLVPIIHSTQLRDTINSFSPDQTAILTTDNVVGPVCTDQLGTDPTPFYHCFEPNDTVVANPNPPPAQIVQENSPIDVVNYLDPFRLNNTPTRINITSDESNKTFYWLKIFKSSAEQFSRVEASVTGHTVTIKISDTTTNKLSLNLGTTSITDIIAQPGLGFPAGVYKVQGGGNNQNVSYSSGYLTINVSSASTPYTVTISLIPGSSPTFYTYLPIVIKK